MIGPHDTRHYILNSEGIAEPAASEKAWLDWICRAEAIDARRIAMTEIASGFVSTIFIGVNMRMFDDGPPLLYETAICDEHGTRVHGRTSSRDLAIAMHARACQEASRMAGEAEAATAALLKVEGP